MERAERIAMHVTLVDSLDFLRGRDVSINQLSQDKKYDLVIDEKSRGKFSASSVNLANIRLYAAFFRKRKKDIRIYVSPALGRER